MVTEKNVFFVEEDIKNIIYRYMFKIEPSSKNSMVPIDLTNYKQMVTEIINNTTIVYSSSDQDEKSKKFAEESLFFENHR